MIFRAGVGLVAPRGNLTRQLNPAIIVADNHGQLPEEKTIQSVPVPVGRGQRDGGGVGPTTLPAITGLFSLFNFDAPRRRQFSNPAAGGMFVNSGASFAKHRKPGEKHNVEIHAGITNTPVQMGGRF